MDNQESARPGPGFMLIAVLALLWNGFGATDYTMTQLHNQAWFDAMKVDLEMLAKVYAAPVWATAGWAVGVWGGFVGALALLLRKHMAANLFLASIVGAVVGFSWQIGAGVNSLALASVITGVAVFLFWYARRAEGQGLLN